MPRTPTLSAQEAEVRAAVVCGPRGSGNINSGNRAWVKAWLIARGVPSAIVEKMKVSSLAKAWNIEAYAQAIIKNRAPDTDSQPDLSGMTPDDDLPAPLPQKPQPKDPQSQEEPKPMTPNPNMTPDQNAAARKLAEALALIQGSHAPLDENRVREIAAEEAAKNARVEFRDKIIVLKPDGEKHELPEQPRHKIFAEILDVLDAGENLMIVGPAGSGKTHVAEQAAAALNLGFNFTGAVASEFKLTGYQDAQGVYRSTAFRRAYQDGGVFLWDEMDASSPSAMLAFNAGLANGQQDFPDGPVKRHPQFRAIASANTYGRGADRLYVGRNQMDAASLDRFVVLEMDYDPALERALFGDTAWTARVQKVRAAVASLKIRHVVSMRAIKAGKALLEKGWSIDKVEAATLFKGLDAPTVAKINAEAR